MIKINDLIHQNEINLIKNYIKNNEKAIIIHGHYGVGKTKSIYLLADDLNYEILDLNPSNISKEFIENLKKSSEQKSLFKKGKIILIDEIDNIEKRNISLIQQIILKTNFPILMTANEISNQKLTAIKKLSKLIEFKKPPYPEIANILEKKCIKEKIDYKKEELEKISRLSNNDIRAALNDLAISIHNKKLEIDLNYRDTEQNIIDALRVIFKTKNLEIASQAFNNVPLDLDECILWIDENLPLEYQDEDLAKAYELLSKATLYKARIIKRQHHRLLYYQNILATAIALSKNEKNNKTVFYKRPSRLLKIYIANKKNHFKREISKKIALKTHNSYKETLKQFPLYRQIINKFNIYNDFKLTEEETIFLKI